MLISILIAGSSLAMLLYWFRYSCVLLRNGHTSEPEMRRAAQTNGLALQSVLVAARDTRDPAGLRDLQELLDKDRRILEFLLEQSGALANIERMMLRADYLAMRLACRVARLACPSIAPAAIREMAATLACFASALGQQTESRRGA
jgi:hypothetical protein